MPKNKSQPQITWLSVSGEDHDAIITVCALTLFNDLLKNEGVENLGTHIKNKLKRQGGIEGSIRPLQRPIISGGAENFSVFNGTMRLKYFAERNWDIQVRVGKAYAKGFEKTYNPTNGTAVMALRLSKENPFDALLENEMREYLDQNNLKDNESSLVNNIARFVQKVFSKKR
ncbi:MAG: hypothetical protein ACTSXQ_05740 [Alphaproteobacteria bacterium]